MRAPQQWRRVVATLADPERRLLYGRILVATTTQPLRSEQLGSTQRRRLSALVRAGLAVVQDGVVSPADPFTELLRTAPAQRPTGPERFLVAGRLAALPRTGRDRLEVFQWLAGRVLQESEVLDERELTRRMADLADAPVALRRYLVDAGVLVRDPDGRNYRRGPSSTGR